MLSQEKGLYRAICEDGECSAEVSGKFRFGASAPVEFPVVGDFVLLTPADGRQSVIHRLLPRKSLFSRKAAGVSPTEQPVAANIDTVFLCRALDRDFNLRRLERYLSIAWDSGAVPVAVLTKADLCDDLSEKRAFFREQGLSDTQIIPVKADAEALPFEKNFFDAVVSTDSYNYFGRDPRYLDEKLLPFVKSDGYLYIAVPGMKQDCHDRLPPELLSSWTPEQLDYLHDVPYWRGIAEQSKDAEVLEVSEMESNEEVWADWLRQENEYAVSDRKSMEAGGGKYLNFVKLVLRKK